MAEQDIADIICILHPCSPSAFHVVKHTLDTSPQHILQSRATNNIDLALRFSSDTKQTRQGFLFGRNQQHCDIVLGDQNDKRISNVHFRIYMNDAGICILSDTSSNGTLVDDAVLRGKLANAPHTRMLKSGSVIQLLSTSHANVIKFIVRLPNRQGHEQVYTQRFNAYMQLADNAHHPAPHVPVAHAATKPFISTHCGMKWDGGQRFNVIGLLGSGAFASVFKVASKSDGTVYAAKELEKRRFMRNGRLDPKLENELRIMQTITHTHIVRYLEYHESQHHLYIIMEHIACGNLQERLYAQGTITEQLAQTIARQILAAMSYLHAHNVVHRDIKPDNLLISDNNNETFSVKLTDFGLSKIIGDSAGTFLKTFCGTLNYCAPEVFPHHRPDSRNTQVAIPSPPHPHSYSPAVDVWSFGAVLWYALVGHPPFQGAADANGRGMYESIMSTILDTTLLTNWGISARATSFITSLLQIDPATRPTPAKCLAHPWITSDIVGTGDTAQHQPSRTASGRESEGLEWHGWLHDATGAVTSRELSNPFESAALMSSVAYAHTVTHDAASTVPPTMSQPDATFGDQGIHTTAPVDKTHDRTTVTTSDVSMNDQKENIPNTASTMSLCPLREQTSRPQMAPQVAFNTIDDTTVRHAQNQPKAIPCLGRLITTQGSDLQLNVELDNRLFSFGRGPNNTVTWPDSQDTKVPKRAFIVYWQANGINQAQERGQDWTKLTGLHCLIASESSIGVKVNGVRLKASERKDVMLLGKLYTGDVITIFGRAAAGDRAPNALRSTKGSSRPPELSFRCELYHGETKMSRPSTQARFEAKAYKLSSDQHLLSPSATLCMDT